jgi:transcriptional regulator with XRE-family HTH domain
MTDIQGIIATWDWRIRRVGMTAQEFASAAGVLNSSLSEYKSGRQMPRPRQYEIIEGKLKELEKAKGIK